MSALVAATTRELSWGLAIVAWEVRHWWRLAERIPDMPLREQALKSLREKRPNTNGAALLSTLPRHRSRDLVRGIVAYEILGDYLDTTNECASREGVVNGLQLNQALYDALDPSAPIGDYYRHHAWRGDGGYLRTLVQVSRDACVRLPSFEGVRPYIAHSTHLATLCQALNHEPDPDARAGGLQAVAAAYYPDRSELAWFEWTGAASAWLTDLALLALAADPRRTANEARRVHGAYMPWISLAATMLDSYSDIAEDAMTGGQSFLANYGGVDEATQRLVEVLERSMQEAVLLGRGYRHVVIVACMIAMYLSKDGACAPEMRAGTHRIVRVGGELTRLLVPVLRVWRTLHGLQGA